MNPLFWLHMQTTTPIPSVLIHSNEKTEQYHTKKMAELNFMAV
jgi:hypothetical protein